MLRLLLVLNARYAGARGRTVLSLAGIALGVALGFAVQLINRAAVDEFTAAVRSLAGEADLEVRGGRSGFSEDLYATLAKLPGVALASPLLELDAALAGTPRAIKLIGLDPLRAAQIQPALFADEPRRMFELLKPDAVYLSAAAAEALQLKQGDSLRIVVGLEPVELEVAGVLPSGALRGVAALTDIATAQWRLARLGSLNRIDLRFAPGVDTRAMRKTIEALLPAGAHVADAQTLEEQGASLSRAYRVNLNVLAMVALFTGAFLVFSAQALEVARRRGEHGLLRVLGLTRGGVARLVLAEAAAIGAIGAALGIALGYLLARIAVGTVGADLGAGHFRGVAPEIAFHPTPAALFFVAGVGVALIGAWLPALDAAAGEPARALKAGDGQRMFEKIVPLWPGLALLATGGALAQLGPVDGIPLFGYASIACILVAGILLLPRLQQAALARMPAMRAAPLSLAIAQLRGSPGQAMVSLAAIVASFALMVSMAIMVSSFRQSVDEWLEAVLPAQLYFRTTFAGETAFLEPEFEAQVRALPQVARAEFLRSGRITLDASRPAVVLVARDMADPGEPGVPLVARRANRAASDPPPAWVSEAVADLYGFQPGRRIELPFAGRPHPFVVEGVWRDYARQHGAILIERARYAELTGDRRANDAGLWLTPGVSPAQAIAALRALPGGERLDIAEPGEIRALSLRIFDRSFAVTYLLEAVAVLVGLFGLSSSLGAIVLARRREFGMLRHIGMTRRQIGAMLAMEGGMLAAFGAAAGLALGWLISLVLVHVVNRQSFNWGMDMHPPYAMLALLALAMVALAIATAALAAREATGVAPVRAVKEDW